MVEESSQLNLHELEAHVEWGGPTWVDQVRRGLEWLGPLDGLRILEVGAREGGMSLLFARMGATVVGVDIDEQALSVARDRARSAGITDRARFELRSGAPDDLPRGFDLVFTKSVLVLARDLAGSAAAIHNVLEPGGRLLAIENARGPFPYHLARMIVRRSTHPHGARYFTKSRLAELNPWFDLALERWTPVPPTVLIGAVRRTLP